MAHFVYILRCADDSLYVGETQYLRRRLCQHEDGIASGFTRTRRPVTMVYAEAHASRLHALARERQLKGWTRSKKESLVAGDLALLKKL